jgi:hypothetical protein
MPAPKLTQRLFWAAEILLLGGTVVAAVLLGRSEEWHPALLVALLLVLALLGERFSVELSDGQISASTIAIVLAMGLLGPGVASACGIAAMVLASAARRISPARSLCNLAAFAVVPFAGGWVVRLLASDLHVLHNHHLEQSCSLGLIVLGVFVVALVSTSSSLG